MNDALDLRSNRSLLGAPARAFRSFLPSSIPYLSRRSYALELGSTTAFAFALALVEGGVVAVFAKQTFTGIVPETRLNFAVALLGAMDAMANILSFLWSPLAQGSPKVKFVNSLQVCVIAIIACMAALPTSEFGLYLLVLLVLTARSCWSGIITVRPTIWRSNYPRHLRAGIIGRFSTVQVVVVALVGLSLGALLDTNDENFRIAVPIFCLIGLGAVWFFSKVRVRREGDLLRRERSGEGVLPPWKGPLIVWRVLRQDRWYAKFMLWMFVLGTSNLMVVPILVITLREEFNLSYFWSILISSAGPLFIMPLAIPMWARVLDRAHVVRFRSIHSWVFVAAAVIFFLGALLHRVELMFLGQLTMGFGYAGGTLAWNLGHVDFSPPSQTSQYMATHVTLNGLRGLLAPLMAVSIFEGVKAAGGDNPGAWVFACSLILSVIGAMGFVQLNREMGKLASQIRRDH